MVLRTRRFDFLKAPSASSIYAVSWEWWNLLGKYHVQAYLRGMALLSFPLRFSFAISEQGSEYLKRSKERKPAPMSTEHALNGASDGRKVHKCLSKTSIQITTISNTKQ